MSELNSPFEERPYEHPGKSDGYTQRPYQNQQSHSGSNYHNQSNSSGGYHGSDKKQFYPKRNKVEDLSPGELYKPYVATGNREASPRVLEQFAKVVKDLEEFNFTVRTGGFDGPDAAVEKAVQSSNRLELYIPWKGFNEKESKFYFNTKQSLDIAKMFHPAFDGLKPAIQAFLAKNARMMLGDKLKSVPLFLLCWSEDGCEHAKDRTARTGNVGHVISIASALHIPIFNLGRSDAESRLKHFLEIS